ncbi:unnamed protein product [Rhizoctonia solani]|uniref:F-box domain-containing protein n=1 Tax=Rhizoctonia solani TaxID=456999 RepID=A0A8H3HHF5_9AGAM|nr:unnamed protein product [Rhizoctonia solani]
MNNTTPLTLGGISTELIIKILHHCECLTILRFAATCKAYNELVAQSVTLQLHIELEANCLELVKGSFKQDATYPVILEDLTRFRDAWLDLDIGEPITRPVGKSDMLLWELREGFYIVAFSQSEGRYADALQFIPLDPETPDPPPLLFDFTFNEFTADPGQGLVAIISRDPQENKTSHVRLCSSSTGLAHPLAQHPRLTAEFDFKPPLFGSGFAIEIMGHTVLAKVSCPLENVYEILIWDWRFGVLLHRISSRDGICDFTFLDQQHLVVMSATHSAQDSLALLIYDISDDKSACNASPNKPMRATDLPISQPILRLEFPRLKQSAKISEMGLLLRSDPTPDRKIYANSAAFACPYAVTLGITFCFHTVGYDWAAPPFYRVFLDGRSLRDHIRTNSHNGTQVLPWSAWGTNATRWFVTPEEPDHWICWMSGSKYTRPLTDSHYYCVFDFSSLTVGRFQERFKQLYPTVYDRLVDNSDLHTGDGFGDLELLDRYLLAFLEDSPIDTEPVVLTVGADNPSIIAVGNDEDAGFDEPVISQLPYRLVCKDNNEIEHEGWQINGDCIIGVAPWSSPAESITIYKLKNLNKTGSGV